MSQACSVKQTSPCSSYLNRPIVSDCTKLLFERQNNIKCVDQILKCCTKFVCFFFQLSLLKEQNPVCPLEMVSSKFKDLQRQD